jgi:hypothetical protein
MTWLRACSTRVSCVHRGEEKRVNGEVIGCMVWVGRVVVDELGEAVLGGEGCTGLLFFCLIIVHVKLELFVIVHSFWRLLFSCNHLLLLKWIQIFHFQQVKTIVCRCVSFSFVAMACHPRFSLLKWRSHTDTRRHGFYKTRIGIIFLDISACVITLFGPHWKRF